MTDKCHSKSGVGRNDQLLPCVGYTVQHSMASPLQRFLHSFYAFVLIQVVLTDRRLWTKCPRLSYHAIW